MKFCKNAIQGKMRKVVTENKDEQCNKIKLFTVSYT